MKASLSLALLAVSAALTQAADPLELNKGIHLLLDYHFIARSDGVVRQVVPPQRSLSEPIVTGAIEHQNWQPFFTVLHDASAKKPFRMWYNVDTVDDPADGNFFGVTGHLDSTDGIRWPGPYERLNSLTVDG